MDRGWEAIALPSPLQGGWKEEGAAGEKTNFRPIISLPRSLLFTQLNVALIQNEKQTGSPLVPCPH